MASMGKLEFGLLREAWKGEASDFTPLLSEQLDDLGAAVGLNLTAVGETEVPTAGGRRIDIVGSVGDGAEFVIENQFGRADHDHLTRGLAYAVARRARGLIVVAEEHRDEFRAVAGYLNEMWELAPERGIAVWLVEAKAVRIGPSPWAPLFVTVVSPNNFIAEVEEGGTKTRKRLTRDEFIQALIERNPKTVTDVALRVMKWCETNGGNLTFGSGRKQSNCFLNWKNASGSAVWPISIGSTGTVDVRFKVLQRRPPFDDAGARDEFRRRINKIPGVTLPGESISLLPSFPLTALAQPRGCESPLVVGFGVAGGSTT